MNQQDVCPVYITTEMFTVGTWQPSYIFPSGKFLGQMKNRPKKLCEGFVL